MIKIENVEVFGWEAAIRGMRNPMNSWNKSDSDFRELYIGPNDLKLMTSLGTGGPSHSKYRRMITVYVDITAPLYWWKEFDTYKVGTVANSCSTMHKIQAKAFELNDFSCEYLIDVPLGLDTPLGTLRRVINVLENYRNLFNKTGDKNYWLQMIQLLPASYNQRRTVMLNYEVLNNMYFSRKYHKLDEWRVLCSWIEQLPYSQIIRGGISNE